MTRTLECYVKVALSGVGQIYSTDEVFAAVLMAEAALTGVDQLYDICYVFAAVL